jgi:hypothetical protein
VSEQRAIRGLALALIVAGLLVALLSGGDAALILSGCTALAGGLLLAWAAGELEP